LISARSLDVAARKSWSKPVCRLPWASATALLADAQQPVAFSSKNASERLPFDLRQTGLQGGRATGTTENVMVGVDDGGGNCRRTQCEGGNRKGLKDFAVKVPADGGTENRNKRDGEIAASRVPLPIRGNLLDEDSSSRECDGLHCHPLSDRSNQHSPLPNGFYGPGFCGLTLSQAFLAFVESQTYYNTQLVPMTQYLT
jgi:hypothetical protein